MGSAKIRIMVGKAWVEVDAVSAKDAIKAISPYYEVFGERQCGQCGSDDIGVNHRNTKGYDYYALKCYACGAQLDFGQHQEGETLFPKRKLPSGEWDSAKRGWYKWQDRKPSEGGEGF